MRACPQLTMAVNVSAMEFRNEHFLENVFAVLDETGLDPKSLELELTESVLMKRAESATSILQNRCGSEGCRWRSTTSARDTPA